MKVRIKVSIASAEWSYAPGQVVKVDDAIGAAWCESGVAEAVAAPANANRPDPKA